MATKVTNLENPQQIEAVVSGPDGASRLIICNGIAPIDQTADASTVTQIWTWLIGPVLSHMQFQRAICNGALIRISHSGGTANWSLVALDADWDDESGQVEVRAEIQLTATGAGSTVRAQGISYDVSILATLATESAPTTGTSSTTLPPLMTGMSPMPATPPPAGYSWVYDQQTNTWQLTPTGTPPPATGSAGTISVSPLGYDFSVVQVGMNRDQSFAITNTGGVNISSLSVGVFGLDASQFTIIGSTTKPGLPPGGVFPVPIRFQPASSGSKNAVLRINYDGSTTMDVPLTGSGLTPTPPPPGTSTGALVAMPAFLDFGAFPLGLLPDRRTLTITNNGTTESGPFQVVLVGADASQFLAVGDLVYGLELTIGGSGTLEIGFMPTSMGPKTASLQIFAQNGGVVAVALAGTGTTLTPPSTLAVAPSKYDFGAVQVGLNRDQSFAITNTGSVNISSISVGVFGPDATEFTVVGSTTKPGLPPGGVFPVPIRFQPASPGPKSALLRINYDGSTTMDVPLTGSGLTPTTPPTGTPFVALSWMPPTLDFGVVPVNTQAPPERTLTVTNNGTADSGPLQIWLAGADAGQFSLVGDPLKEVALAPGGSGTQRVLFQPTSTGTKTASLQISTSLGGAFAVTFTGTGK